MYKVVTKRFLNEAKTICLFEIEAPLVAKHAQAGQFVIFRLDEQGERVPVSVAGWDREKGTVTVMVQAAGRTTKMLHTVEQGDYISDFVGPLGRATEMDGLKKVCVVGGGVGCAIAYPIAKEMHKKGIEVTFIGGFRSADIVILKDELKEASDKLIMCTDDGTYGEKGFTTQYLKQEIDANIAEGKPQFDRVIAIGPKAASIARTAGEAAEHFDTIADALPALRAAFVPGAAALVKASHAMEFGKIVKELETL